MAKWFIALAKVDNPGTSELVIFLDELSALLEFVVQSDDFKILWRRDRDLQSLAVESFKNDIVPAMEALKSEVHKIPKRNLERHGLVGRPARFKYAVMARLSRAWRKRRGRFTVGSGFRRVVEGAEPVLDSILDAVPGGIGAIIKEFKDSLLALAP